MPFLLTPLFVPETLIDESRLPDNRLPDTGVGLDKEQLLSPMFITSKSFQYGTRCTTAMMISNDDRILVAEKSYPQRSIVELSFGVVR